MGLDESASALTRSVGTELFSFTKQDSSVSKTRSIRGGRADARAVDGRYCWRVQWHLEEPNDFAIATALAFSRRNTARYEAPIEVQLAHAKPAHAAEYEPLVEAPVRFGAPCNAIVIDAAVATLRRHLEDEGTSFAALLEEARRDLAFEYLRDRSLTLTEIAFLLGYGSVSSFGRAFQRWTGRTPAAHRAEEGLRGAS